MYGQTLFVMNKKLKEKIKLAASAGFKLTMTKLGISKPSSKLESALKKHSKKLIEEFRKELKKKSKEKAKDNKKTKVVRKTKAVKTVPRRASK